MPFSEPVMMRVSSKHSRVQRVITGVCRTARSFCANGRMQGRRSGWHGARAAGPTGVAGGWQGGGRGVAGG